MTTTTKTADFVGRALITPDTNARDYLLRPTGAGDRDFMGRLLTGGGGGDVSALLAEAAVRFDFSQYDDVDDMVDVNGGWGPLVPAFLTVESTEFTATGLRIVYDDGEGGSGQMNIDGTAGPLTIGPDGFTYLFVYVIPTHVPLVTILDLVIVACDSANNFAPSVQLEWELSQIPDVAGDPITLRIQEGEPEFAEMVEDVSPGIGEPTPLTTRGVFIMAVTCDVPAGETRHRLVNADTDFNATYPFPTVPTFASTATPADYIALGTSTGVDEEIFVDFLGWNRPLETGEVDALVTHYLETPVPPARPIMTASVGASQDNPATGPSVVFDIVFSEAVTGFATGDVVPVGGANPTTADVTDNGDHIHFTVTVSGMTDPGGVALESAAGVCVSTANGTPNLALAFIGDIDWS